MGLEGTTDLRVTDLNLVGRARLRLGQAAQKLAAAVAALKTSLGDALAYERCFARVRPLTRSLAAIEVPLLPGDEIPDLERKRAADGLASRVSAATTCCL